MCEAFRQLGTKQRLPAFNGLERMPIGANDPNRHRKWFSFNGSKKMDKLGVDPSQFEPTEQVTGTNQLSTFLFDPPLSASTGLSLRSLCILAVRSRLS